MNRKHEHVSCQVGKTNIKLLKENLSIDNHKEPIKGESPKKTENKPLHHKKTSKRTSPQEKIENSTPSHCHKEGTRWVNMLQKQTEENNKRMIHQEHHKKTN